MKTTPKDFFLHLGATIALYVGAIALMNLAFTIINKVLPDNLSTYWSSTSIVWPISMLIVLVPVLYVLEWLIIRDTVKMPEKKEIWVRRWRIYLTLFLTGATIVGDLVVLINTYLNGEVTGRFIYKVLVVLIVSAVIFAYYLLAKMSDSGKGKTWQKILTWLGIVLVLAAIIGGFIIVGSPGTQRALRFDETRVNDLTSIQYQVLNYWQRTGKLPETIQTLNDPLSGFTIPVDPDTQTSYEYVVKGKTAFELCATFSLPSQSTSNQNGRPISYPTKPMPVGSGFVNDTNDVWSHDAGHACFVRTIDPTLYPPTPKNP